MHDELAAEIALNTILPEHSLPLVYCALTPDTIEPPDGIELTPLICGIHTDDARQSLRDSMIPTFSPEILTEIEDTGYVFISLEIGRFFQELTAGCLQVADLFMGPLLHQSDIWTSIEPLVMRNLCESGKTWHIMHPSKDDGYLNKKTRILAASRRWYFADEEEYEWEFGTLGNYLGGITPNSAFVKMFRSIAKNKAESALADAIADLKIKLT